MIFAVALASLWGCSVMGGELPELEAVNLLEHEVRFPQDLGGTRPFVLAVGFTKASQAALSKCGDWFESKTKNLPTYSVAVLEGVPFFVKGLVRNGIQKSVTEARRARFLLVFEGKEALQKLAGFKESAEDLAFVLGVRPGESAKRVEFSLPGDCSGSHAENLLQKLRAEKYL